MKKKIMKKILSNKSRVFSKKNEAEIKRKIHSVVTHEELLDLENIINDKFSSSKKKSEA